MQEKVDIHQRYMQRCVELAYRAAGYVAPNPMVGAVLVHRDRIIGEGYHREFGAPHAEVNCINNAIENGFENLLPEAAMYVSLEPCAHFGKTPPCADLIVKKNIPAVFIGCRDPFIKVDGRGIERLQSAAVMVTVGVLENECRKINKRFLLFHTQHRPYIVLKWAQTANGKIANHERSRLLITNEFTNRLVHKWRSEEAAILVGTNTARYDNPQLTTRLWAGRHPIRLVVDMDLQLPKDSNIFDDQQKTIVFTKLKHAEEGTITYYQVSEDTDLVHQISNALYQLQIVSVLVEGGARLLQSFIDTGLWDEARVITNQEMVVPGGLPAPELSNAESEGTSFLGSDIITSFRRTNM